MAIKNNRRLSHLELLTLTDEIRTHREMLTSECHSVKEASAWLMQRTQIPNITDAITDSLLKLTKVELAVRRRPGKAYDSNRKGTAGNRVRVLTRCVYDLYQDLGKTVPKQLQAMMDTLTQADSADAPTEPPATPAEPPATPAKLTLPPTPNGKPSVSHVPIRVVNAPK